MSEISRRSGLLGALAGIGAIAAAQVNPGTPPPEDPADVRLPNGKRQRDEILKAEYQQNLKDSRQLTELAKSVEVELEKTDGFVLSLGLLKKLDDMEKLTKRIRGRMRK